MDNAQTPFFERLAQMRHRLEPMLLQRGISMSWELEPFASEDLQKIGGSVHLAAIVQEALSNALQHANPKKISVKVNHLEHVKGLCLEVSDDGCGVETKDAKLAHQPAGLGLTNMACRARLVGGELSVMQSGEGGTCIRVIVPWNNSLSSESNRTQGTTTVVSASQCSY